MPFKIQVLRGTRRDPMRRAANRGTRSYMRNGRFVVGGRCFRGTRPHIITEEHLMAFFDVYKAARTDGFISVEPIRGATMPDWNASKAEDKPAEPQESAVQVEATPAEEPGEAAETPELLVDSDITAPRKLEVYTGEEESAPEETPSEEPASQEEPRVEEVLEPAPEPEEPKKPAARPRRSAASRARGGRKSPAKGKK
jgi:hypothetical protein